MELPISCMSGNCEVHAVIRFHCVEGTNIAEIHRWLCTMYGVDRCYCVLSTNGCTTFVMKNAPICTTKKERDDRRKRQTRKQRTQSHTFSEDNWHVTLDKICEWLTDQNCIEIFRKSIQRVVTPASFPKVSAGWVPFLTNEHRTKISRSCAHFSHCLPQWPIYTNSYCYQQPDADTVRNTVNKKTNNGMVTGRKNKLWDQYSLKKQLAVVFTVSLFLNWWYY